MQDVKSMTDAEILRELEEQTEKLYAVDSDMIEDSVYVRELGRRIDSLRVEFQNRSETIPA